MNPVVTGEAMTSGAAAVQLGNPTGRLLAAYGETLDTIDRLPPAPMVAVGWRPIPPLRRRLRLPRPRWMLRALTVRHIDRVLAELERRYSRQTALAERPASESAEAKAIAAFRASLPPGSWRLRVTALVLATLVVARLLGTMLPRRIEVIPWLPGQDGIAELFNSTFGAFEPSTSSFSAALDDLLQASLAELAAFSLLLTLAAFVVMRPLMTSVRLKRMLFNLHPHAAGALHGVPASWSVSRATGIYELERAAFEARGGRAPREVPVDLIVPLVFAIVAASVYVAGGIIVNPDTPLAFAVMFALVFYATPGVFRAAWLLSGWRARRDTVRRPRWLIADEIVVAWRSDTVRRRSPTLIGFAGLGLIYLVPVWWWWCAMRELRDFGRAHDVRELAGLNPAVEAALMAGAWFLVPPFITLLQAPRRVRAAQVAAGLERPLDTRIVWLVPIVPLFCMLLQRELNRIWDTQGAVPAGQLSTK